MDGDKIHCDPSLVEAVRKQIEYYFSPENLLSDVYLTQQMDANRSVPISVVMKFAKMKALTQDEAVVRLALVDSSIVTIVDNRIKANVKTAARSTVILRDITPDATEESVREIFNFPGAKSLVSVKGDIGGTWFVVFESEQDAKDTLLDLKLKKRTFNGQPVKARIKTENVVRSYYPVPSIPSVPAMFPVGPFPGLVPGPMEMVPFGFVTVPVEGSELETLSPPVNTVSNKEKDEKDSEEKKNNAVAAATRNSTVGARPVRSGAVPGRDREGRRGGEGRRTGDARNTRNEKDQKEKKPSEGKVSIEINATTFPPLHVSEETPIPTPGYSSEYIKFSFDDIIAIVKEVKEAPIPVEVDAAAHTLAMTTEPNLDLLRRQRTFSIDETREQLRQGRPVLKDAILPGAVDYKSMMYGEVDKSGQQKKAETEKKAETFCSEKDEAGQSPSKQGSSWAALVKSAASLDISQAVPVAVTPKTPAKKAVSKEATKDKATTSASDKKDTSGNSGKKEGKKESEKKAKKKSAEKEIEDAKAETDKGERVDTPTLSWGGKASFANVLKQTLSEDPTPITEVKKTSAPSKSEAKSTNKPSKRVTEVDGKWVKEALPPATEK